MVNLGPSKNYITNLKKWLQYESSRLLDDDLYQSNYGYGALNHANQVQQPDPESIRREREALESICQRTSEYAFSFLHNMLCVSFLIINRSVIDIWSIQPQPHLQPRATLPRSSSSGSHKDTNSANNEPPVTVTTVSAASSHTASDKSAGTVPRHWGEVVINPRREKSRKGGNTGAREGRDVFGVLEVSWKLSLSLSVACGFFCMLDYRLRSFFPLRVRFAAFCQSPVDGFSPSIFIYNCSHVIIPPFLVSSFFKYDCALIMHPPQSPVMSSISMFWVNGCRVFLHYALWSLNYWAVFPFVSLMNPTVLRIEDSQYHVLFECAV